MPRYRFDTDVRMEVWVEAPTEDEAQRLAEEALMNARVTTDTGADMQLGEWNAPTLLSQEAIAADVAPDDPYDGHDTVEEYRGER